MEQIKRIGNYLLCPYCDRMFGNGISVVYSNVVMACNCKGMRDAREAIKSKEIEEKEHPQITYKPKRKSNNNFGNY